MASVLEDIVEGLGNLRELSKESVAGYLAKQNGRLQEIAALAQFSRSDPYGRNIIESNHRFEILLTGWEPGKTCLPHDHGGSDGVVLVCQGEAQNRMYRQEGPDLSINYTETIERGRTFHVGQGEIHRTANTTHERMVGLHVYWPAPKGMTVYEPETRREFSVTGDAGAWIPSKEENIGGSRMACLPLRKCMKRDDLTRSQYELLSEATEYVEAHALWRHPFFEVFSSGQMTEEQLRIFALQRHFSSRRFPQFLGAFVANIENNLTQKAVQEAYVKQMWEETGEGDAKKTHSLQLRQFGYELGLSDTDYLNATMLSGTEQFVNTYWSICKGGDLFRGQGAFALGTEPVVPLEMQLDLRGLDRVKVNGMPLSENAKVYFKDHAHHDLRHTKELVAVLLPTLQRAEQYRAALGGMREIIDARKALYDGIAKECNIT